MMEDLRSESHRANVIDLRSKKNREARDEEDRERRDEINDQQNDLRDRGRQRFANKRATAHWALVATTTLPAGLRAQEVADSVAADGPAIGVLIVVGLVVLFAIYALTRRGNSRSGVIPGGATDEKVAQARKRGGTKPSP